MIGAASFASTAPTAQAAPRDTPRFFTINQIMQGKSAPPLRKQVAEAPALFENASFRGAFDADGPESGELAHPFASTGFELFDWSSASMEEQWRSVVAARRDEEALIAACANAARRCASAPAQEFIRIRDAAAPLAGAEKIAFVNAAVNASIRYQSDYEHHGIADLWSAPLASLKGRGDCEDYAIAKMFVLKAAGIRDEDLTIVFLRDSKVGEDHAVLSVKLDGRWLMLDNRWDHIEQDKEHPEYSPIYSLHMGKIAMFAAPYILQRTSWLNSAILR